MPQPGSASEPESIRLKGKAVQQTSGKSPSQNGQTQEQEVDDNTERHGENSFNTEIKRETPEMPVTWGKGAESKREGDLEMPNKDSQPYSLVDFDYCLDREDEFEGNGTGGSTVFSV